MKTQCGECESQPCRTGGLVNEDFCPLHSYPDVFQAAEEIYRTDPGTEKLARNADLVEHKGYIQWPRLKEIIEFSKNMGYRRLVVAFCPDLWFEAKKTVAILQKQGFDLKSVVCRMPSAEIDRTDAPRPYDLSCFADNSQTAAPDLIIMLGLCIAAEAAFSNEKSIPKTVFIARDRVTYNNPAVRIYRSRSWRGWSVDHYLSKKTD